MHFSSFALDFDVFWFDLVSGHFAFKLFSVHDNFKQEFIQVFEAFGLHFVQLIYFIAFFFV